MNKLITTAVALVAAAAFVFGPTVLGFDAEKAEATTTQDLPFLVVRPGGTLEGVAKQTAPEGVSVKKQARRIMEVNRMTSSDVDAWEVLFIPR